jgi:hypothetical protein
MTPLATSVFDGITPERWERLKAAATDALGCAVEVDKGSAGHDGVEIDYAYDAVHHTLTVNIDARKWYDPSIGELVEKFQAWVEGVQ